MANDSSYTVKFDYSAGKAAGDWYNLEVIAPSGTYTDGQVVKTNYGQYTVQKHTDYGGDAVALYGADHAEGTVYMTNYHNHVNNADVKPYYQTLYDAGDHTKVAGHSYLGSEHDYQMNANGTYLECGNGGKYDYQTYAPSTDYYFTFYSTKGGYYKGWVTEHTDTYTAGQRVNTDYGYYTIDSKQDIGYSKPDDYHTTNGYVHVTAYHQTSPAHDYTAQTDFNFENLWRQGYASGYQGLGSEDEYVKGTDNQLHHAIHGGDIWY